jgi:hypothetical protein
MPFPRGNPQAVDRFDYERCGTLTKIDGAQRQPALNRRRCPSVKLGGHNDEDRRASKEGRLSRKAYPVVAEARGGHPAVAECTEILRIDFDDPDGTQDEKLRRISWEEFFRIFDSRELEFL